MDYNKVTLQGTVTELKFSHQTALENYYAATFAVERLSKTIDVLPLTISDKLIKDHHIEIGSQILVTGQLRSYNMIIENKNRLILTVFVKDIFETDTEATSNNIELVGHICKPTGSDDYLTINRSGTGSVRCLPYSDKHKAFNCHDNDETPEYAIDVAFWAYIPEKIKKFCEELWKKYEEEEDNE